jgi:ribosomal protein S18 acetylase RimI-like enzyme
VAQVRRIRRDEGALLRELTLAALRDAPDAFALTLVEEQARPAAEWAARAEAEAAGCEVAMFVAFDDDAAVGTAGGFREDPVTVGVWSVWIRPQARGRGHGHRLLAAVEDWAASRGYRTTSLFVGVANEPALRLYLDHGYASTGREAPLASNPGIRELELARQLPRVSSRRGRGKGRGSER